jgi:hypothetical protein
VWRKWNFFHPGIRYGAEGALRVKGGGVTEVEHLVLRGARVIHVQVLRLGHPVPKRSVLYPFPADS